MKLKTATFVICFLVQAASFAQVDTTVLNQQKGFLFLSDYNYLYDYKGGEIKNLGFHDFFYPADAFDVKCLLDSNKSITFKNGVRVDFFSKRKYLKTQAKSFACDDTTGCYRFKNFYIIPVTINYKLYEDYEPFICQKNFYELKILGRSQLKFTYQHKAISITRVLENIPKRK